jgi:hypothetical protein
MIAARGHYDLSEPLLAGVGTHNPAIRIPAKLTHWSLQADTPREIEHLCIPLEVFAHASFVG